MGRALALDLRERVVEAIEDGLTHRKAAARFSLGIATAGAWHRRWRATGSVTPDHQGHPRRSKLDAHETFIMDLLEEQKDMTLEEIAERLAT
ncbi:MAG: IS630 transposase-related protein, partial [Pseudomonadota bacterium]